MEPVNIMADTQGCVDMNIPPPTGPRIMHGCNLMHACPSHVTDVAFVYISN